MFALMLNCSAFAFVTESYVLFMFFFLLKISQFREKEAEKRKEQEKKDRQQLEQLQKFLQEQAAYDSQRYCN